MIYRPLFLFCLMFFWAIFGLAVEASAHDTRSAQRLESSLAKLSIRLGNIETQLRKMTGKIEDEQYTSDRTKKQLVEQAKDLDKRVKSIELNMRRVMRAVKAMASKKPSRGNSSSPSAQDSRLARASASPGGLYNYALSELFDKKNYPSAERAFDNFIKKYPDHEKAGAAHYWLGESFYVRKNYREAASAYLRGFNTYGTSSKAAESLLKLGMSLAALNEWDEACSTYDKLRSTFPSAPQYIIQRLSAEYERVQCNAGFTG